MKKKAFWTFFPGYLQQHLNSMLLGIFCGVLFFTVFWLHSLPMEALGYAGLLCVVAAAVYAGVDFCHYVEKSRLLENIADMGSISFEKLPKADNRTEELYQQILKKSDRERVDIISKEEQKQKEMVDYYTMWVHQIKTPIAAMDLLLQTGEDGHQEVLASELFKIQQYVDMVLQYLRIESPDNDLVLKQYDLDGIIRQAVRKYASVFIQKGISLKYEPVHCTVLTDEKWLGFVMEQILSNALKYTSKGSVSIYIEEGGKTLVIEDTGMGIAAEDMKRVFEKGYTGWNGRRDKKSTGIGLYLCKMIMTRLSHQISMESGVGVGTKVKLQLDTAETDFLTFL